MPNPLLQVRGRVFAVDYLLYTLAESGSTLGGGWAVDALGWGTRRLSCSLAALAAGFTVRRNRVVGAGGRGAGGGGKATRWRVETDLRLREPWPA